MPSSAVDPPPPSLGSVSRRSLIIGSIAAGAIAIGDRGDAANAVTYTVKTREEHAALPITWRFPLRSTAVRRAGVEGYPGDTYPGHQGVDYFPTAGAGAAVLAIADGRVTAVGDDGEQGRGVYIVVEHAAGVRSEYLHLERNSLTTVPGRVVSRGTSLGRVGWTGDVRPKTPANAHLHLAILSGAYRTGTVWNAAWLIDDNPPLPEEEDDMAYPFIVDNTHLFMLAPGFVKHFGEYAPAVRTRDIISPDGEWIVIASADFIRQLDSFGVPRNVVDAAAGRVLDVSTGQMAAGGMWSWAREAQQNTRAILAALNSRP